MSASARMGWAPREPSAGERQAASGGAAGPDNAPATAGTVAADATPQPGPAAGGDTLQAALAEARLTAAVASVESEERSAGLAAEGAAAAPAGASRVRAGNGAGNGRGGGGGGGAAQASAQEAGPAQAAQAQTAVAPGPGPGASPAAGAAAPPGAAPPAAAAPAPPPALGGTVAGLVAGTRSCVLRPCAFFVSWQGVLTLAFSGLPPALVALKAGLEAAHAGLPRENPGSRWPKATLGMLGDARRLLPDQLARLNALCAKESAGFEGGAGAPGIVVDRAAVALYECRSLERLVAWSEARFGAPVDEAEPGAEEAERVQRILRESAAPDYWFAASRDGNREAHYRGTHLGATLVFPLPGGGAEGPRGAAGGDAAAALRARIGAFRARVDRELPGMYCWLADGSLHVTLRALMG